MSAVVPDGRHGGVRRVLRVAQATEAQVAEQPALHHHETEPVRDGAHEGVPGTGQTDAVVHQVDHGGRARVQRHAAEAVQQVARLRDGHDQAQQPQPGQRAHAHQSPGLGAREVLLTPSAGHGRPASVVSSRRSQLVKYHTVFSSRSITS